MIEGRRVVPETSVSGIWKYLNLSVGDDGLMLIDGGHFDDRILSTVRDQCRLADPGQKIIVIERSRKQCLTDVGRNGDVVAKNKIVFLCLDLSYETKTHKRLEAAH